MWPYHPDLLETPVPRYTSYPTAADFGALPTTAMYEQIEQASGDISLYLHIPFCEKICYYCAATREHLAGGSASKAISPRSMQRLKPWHACCLAMRE